MIYFIEAVGAGLVKIGFTDREPETRLRELQTASPHNLSIFATLDIGREWEGKFHETFKHLHSFGEWFRFEPELKTFLFAFQAAKAVLAGSNQEFDVPIRAIAGRLVDLEQKVIAMQNGIYSNIDNLESVLATFRDCIPTHWSPWPVHEPPITDQIRRQVLEEEEFRSAAGAIEFLESQRGR